MTEAYILTAGLLKTIKLLSTCGSKEKDNRRKLDFTCKQISPVSLLLNQIKSIHGTLCCDLP